MPHSDAVAAKGRELSESRWELPAKYRVTEAALALSRDELKKQHPEMYDNIVQSEAKQKEWAEKANNPFGQMSPQDMVRAQSVTIVEHLRLTLNDLNKQIGKAATNGVGDVDALQKAQAAVKHQLAERYAIIGRYDLAVQVEPDRAYREHYVSIFEAVYRVDTEHCGCSDVRGSGGHSHITVPSWSPAEDIWSLKHGRIVTLMRCASCGFLNAIDPPAHVIEQRRHRVRAHQVAGHLSPAAAAAELTRRGHTFTSLVKQK